MSSDIGKRIRVGVDVGGTFTDFVLVDEKRDLIFTGKRLTTPEDPGRDHGRFGTVGFGIRDQRART